ncbi:MAG TPA: glycerophosphodiester phosphodiesterase family protein [Thermomicrobiales bacterium]|jgi:glycerophosphoryl diester phosphodiesterase
MLAIAHRGASGYAPENTRAAFDRALAMGAGAIETDVQLSADGELIIFHDNTVDRTSDGRGPLGDYTLAELQALDLGGWYAPEFAGQRILTVIELLDEYAEKIPLALEIKDPRAARPLIAVLNARGIADKVQITSFYWTALLDARSANPDLYLGFLSPTFDDDLITRSVRRGFKQICPHVDRLTAPRVALAHGHGLNVRAWGVSRRDQVERLFDTGADGATCNWPDWILGNQAPPRQ